MKGTLSEDEQEVKRTSSTNQSLQPRYSGSSVGKVFTFLKEMGSPSGSCSWFGYRRGLGEVLGP